MSDSLASTSQNSWAVNGPLVCRNLSPLPGSTKATAIGKQLSDVPLWLGMDGLQGDQIADRRFHGGPDRALCHYPTQHYAYWAQRFPQLRTQLSLGAFGENLGSEAMDEEHVCIGDRLRWGGAVIEVSQPRSPCVRLDSRHGLRGLARDLSSSARTGWLYRTIEEGMVHPGDGVQLLERTHPDICVAYLWRCFLNPSLDEEALLSLAELPRLALHFQAIFRQRYDACRRQRDQHSLFD